MDKITKNGDPDKYSYSEYGIGFDSCWLFSIPNVDWGKNAIIFRIDMSSFVHINNKNKDIIFGKGPTQRLDNTTLTEEAEYILLIFQGCDKNFCFSLHYNGSNSFYLFKPQKYIS